MVEGAGDLLRLDQRVRPVQQQDVHIVGAECAQRLLGLTHDVLIGEVVEGAVLHDPDLRLQGDLLPFGRAEPHGLGEAALTGMGAQTRTVDVGMVEEVDAGLPGRTHQARTCSSDFSAILIIPSTTWGAAIPVWGISNLCMHRPYSGFLPKARNAAARQYVRTDMRAMTYSEYGEPDTLELTEQPTPKVAPGSVLIKVERAAVNPVDWKLMQGHLDPLLDVVFPVSPAGTWPE